MRCEIWALTEDCFLWSIVGHKLGAVGLEQFSAYRIILLTNKRSYIERVFNLLKFATPISEIVTMYLCM